jgi:predicted transcriptional regulator
MKIEQLTKVQRNVLRAFNNLGGWGHRNDICTAAGIDRGYGNHIVNKLLDCGLLRRPNFNDYCLTEKGTQFAVHLEERDR